MQILVTLLAGMALAGEARPDDDAVTAIRALEWARGEPTAITAEMTGRSEHVRVIGARALGRLQSPAALDAIVALRDDPSPAVRLAAAEALALTPGSAPAIRAWLDEEASDARWGVLALRPEDVRPALIDGLGRQGDAADVERLVTALSEPWPLGSSAAEALGRMGRRNVDGVSKAIPALVGALSRPDPRTVEAAAYALRRIGLAEARPAEVATLVEGWDDVPGGPARAWLIRAVWPTLDAEGKQALLAVALDDAATVVRVSALDAVEKDEVPVALVAGALEDDSPWVRGAATAAAGRLGGDAATKLLEVQIAHRAPWGAADAMSALAAAGAAPDPAIALDRTKPLAVRAAAAGTVTDLEALITLTRDPEPPVRSAAAQALLAMASRVPFPEMLNMLESEDIVVRQVAIELLAKRDAEPGAVPLEFVQPLMLQLRVDPDPDVLAAGFELLAARAARRPKDFDAKDKLTNDTVLRGLGHADGYVRVAAAKLRDQLGLQVKALSVLDDVRDPDPADLAKIRSARVITDQGEFRIELRSDVAPLAVANFAMLAEQDYFDGIVWHRVVPAFVVQTGDPRGDGAGGPGWTIPDEVSRLPYSEGAVGMARSGPDTGGSQWFVTLTPQPHLVGDYTLFGYVSEGMHVVKRLERGAVVKDVVIERVEPTAFFPYRPITVR